MQEKQKRFHLMIKSLSMKIITQLLFIRNQKFLIGLFDFSMIQLLFEDKYETFGYRIITCLLSNIFHAYEF